MQRRKHGGCRENAGRKNRHDAGDHKRRPDLKPTQPLHITVRLRDGISSLRNMNLDIEIKRIILRAKKFGLRINHYCILSNHIHLIAETETTEQLKSGMKSFNGCLGRLLRRNGIKGEKFPRGFFKGRYHVQIIKTARQMKNTLKYVLFNTSNHLKRILYIDQYSSAEQFKKWTELLDNDLNNMIYEQIESLKEHPPQYWLPPPRTWLATRGWLRC